MTQDRPQELQQFLAQALAQVGDAVVVIDSEECVTFLNATAAAQYDITEAEAIGQPLRSMYTHHWLQPGAEEAAYASLTERGFWRGENLHVLRNGRKLYVDSTVTALKNVKGEQVGLLAVIRDITAQKETETTLREAQERLRLAVGKAPLSFAHMDRELRYTWNYNPHPDFDPKLLLGKRDDELNRGPAIERFIQTKRQVVDSGKGTRGEFTFPLSDGPRTYDITFEPLYDAAGAVVGLTTAALDITERKAAEEQVRRSEERLRRMMGIAQVGIAFVRQDEQIAECNDALLHLFGYTRAEYTADGLNWQTLQLPIDETHISQSMGRLYDVGVLPPLERTYRRKDGSTVPVMISAAVIQADPPAREMTDSEPQTEHVVFVVDLSELKQAQAALQELNNTLEQRVADRTAELEHSNRNLERSNRELDRFAYIASHDLKSPLRAIDNLATWIAEDTADLLPPAAQVHLTKLRTRVKRLETLLDDLLHYSRAGRRRYTVEPVDTRALAHSVAASLRPPEGFSVQIADHLPTIRSERLPLETVLRGLLENALKHHHHTQEGSVTVTAERRGNWVEFCVRDNGPGIDPQFHERIFEVFQTLRPRDEVEGSGMGLAIVKKTVESAGGRVWVESAEGAGATFFFTWPAGA